MCLQPPSCAAAGARLQLRVKEASVQEAASVLHLHTPITKLCRFALALAESLPWRLTPVMNHC